MSDDRVPLDIATTSEQSAVDTWIARASEGGDALWADPPPGLEDELVRSIGQLARVGRAPRPRVAWWLAAAAAIVMVIAGVAVIAREDDDAAAFTLAGTEQAPDASAEVEIATTPVGLKLLLDPDGLPGAPDGTYYEAWLSNGEVKVSAGTFHLRGGEGAIELWAGVADPSFTTLAVTLEPLDGDLDSSGDAYLRGTITID